MSIKVKGANCGLRLPQFESGQCYQRQMPPFLRCEKECLVTAPSHHCENTKRSSRSRRAAAPAAVDFLHVQSHACFLDIWDIAWWWYPYLWASRTPSAKCFPFLPTLFALPLVWGVERTCYFPTLCGLQSDLLSASREKSSCQRNGVKTMYGAEFYRVIFTHLSYVEALTF